MKIKEVNAEKVFDSRGKEAISVFIKTDKGTFSTASPSGTSTGKYETPCFVESINHDISVLRNLKLDFEIDSFPELAEVEEAIKGKVGANSLYALEASILKAAAYDYNLPLWKFLNPNARKFPYPVGNVIGGGMHTQPTAGKKADFQEFLIIPKAKKISDNFFLMKKAHELAGNILKARGARGVPNYEGAWSTNLENEGCLGIMNQVRDEIEQESGQEIKIGVDVAASSFFFSSYSYKNPARRLRSNEQIQYISDLVEKYRVSYLEDPLNDDAFSDFKILREKIIKRTPCLVVGDDLTVSNFERFRQAIKAGSIAGIILKPNQTGSLLEIKKIIDVSRKLGVTTIMSHRSGETMDYTIADLAFAWQTDLMKTGIVGKEREVKWNRLIEIEKNL